MSLVRKILFAQALLVVAIGAGSGGCEEPKPVKKAACSGRAWIVELEKSGSCPPISKPESYTKDQHWEWVAEEICPNMNHELSKNLQKYCTYTWGGNDWADDTTTTIPAITDEDIQQFPVQAKATAGIKNVDEECVVTQGEGTFEDGVREQLHAKFKNAAGADFKLPLGFSVPATKSWVTVLDSWPKEKLDLYKQLGTQGGADFAFGRDEHGFTLWWLLQKLTTYEIENNGGEQSFADVHGELALPNIDYDHIDKGHGGYFGRQMDLVRAVCNALDAWETARGDNSDFPAPVFLTALGSEPLPGQTCNASMGLENLPLPTRAVIDALEHAACHGVAVIAAAGNDPNGKVNPGCAYEVAGPTCPAGIAAFNAPDKTGCEALYSESTTHPKQYDVSDYRIYDAEKAINAADVSTNPIGTPLIYPVFATDAAGDALATTREGSRVPLAAMGSMGGAQDVDGRWHEPRSGTSLAATVVAATFATLFAQYPTLTAPEVAALIYKSAKETELPAEMWNTSTWNAPDTGPAAPYAKQVTICAALNAVLEAQGKPFIGCTPPNPDPVIQDSTIITELQTLIDSVTHLDYEIIQGQPLPSDETCGGGVEANTPAPGPASCDKCGFLRNGNTGTALIQAPPSVGQGYSRATLVLRYQDQPLDAKALPNVIEKASQIKLNYVAGPGSVFALDGIAVNSDLTLKSAFIEFVMDKSTAVRFEIPLAQVPVVP